MIIDCHVHATGAEAPAQLQRGMDQAGVDKIVLFSGSPPGFPHPGAARAAHAGGDTRRTCEWMSELAAACQDRVIPFLWIDPTAPDSSATARTAVRDFGIRGFKMIPTRWFPYDEKLRPVFETIAGLDVPVLLHSGILFGWGDCSRFCRPVYFEKLLEYAGLRFALAHIGWPWTDECIAVAGMCRSSSEIVSTAEYATQRLMYIDTTRGTPDCYRADVFRKMMHLDVYGFDSGLIFGTDEQGATYGRHAPGHIRKDREIFAELGVAPTFLDNYFHGNLERWLAPRKQASPPEPAPR
jgi:predicted TIM-barrel fold metal-dependent hydrolase